MVRSWQKMPKIIWTYCFSTFAIFYTQPLWTLIQGWEQSQESQYSQPNNLCRVLRKTSTTLWLIKCIESEFWVSDASSNESHVHKLWPILYFLWHGWQMFKNLDWIAGDIIRAAFTLIWSKEKKVSASKLNSSHLD